jgi:hypothetical protein
MEFEYTLETGSYSFLFISRSLKGKFLRLDYSALVKSGTIEVASKVHISLTNQLEAFAVVKTRTIPFLLSNPLIIIDFLIRFYFKLWLRVNDFSGLFPMNGFRSINIIFTD